MKKIIKFISLLLALCIISALSGCNNFTPPPVKETGSSVKLFNNTRFNNINLVPVKLFLKSDGSGYIEYTKTGKLEEVKESIISKVDEVNNAAYSEGDYQAGYRAVYVQDKNITQMDENKVSVLVEFRNINDLKDCEVSLQSVAEYIESNVTDENNKYTDAITKQTSSIVMIDDKDKHFIAVCNGITNQAVITVDGCVITAYHTENSSDIVMIENKNTIYSSVGKYNFVFVESGMPLWLMITAAVAGLSFITVLAVKIVKSAKRGR